MSTDGADLVTAIAEFEAALPDWWWTLGSCGISRDASCYPSRPSSRASCGPDYSKMDRGLELLAFDEGFHYDDVARGSTVANSLRNVMRQALAAKAELASDPEAARLRYISMLMNSRGFSEERASARASEVLGLKAKGKP